MWLAIFFIVILPVVAAVWVALLTHNLAHARHTLALTFLVGVILALVTDGAYLWSLGVKLLFLLLPFVLLAALFRVLVIRPLRR